MLRSIFGAPSDAGLLCPCTYAATALHKHSNTSLVLENVYKNLKVWNLLGGISCDDSSCTLI